MNKINIGDEFEIAKDDSTWHLKVISISPEPSFYYRDYIYFCEVTNKESGAKDYKSELGTVLLNRYKKVNYKKSLLVIKNQDNEFNMIVPNKEITAEMIFNLKEIIDKSNNWYPDNSSLERFGILPFKLSNGDSGDILMNCYNDNQKYTAIILWENNNISTLLGDEVKEIIEYYKTEEEILI